MSRLENYKHKVVWHKEGVGLPLVLSVVETTIVDVVMARQVSSNVVKRSTS